MTPESVVETPKQKSTETFVFVGTYSEVPDAGIKLMRFGQRVELPKHLAEGTQEDGGLLCIPASMFDPLMAEAHVDAAMLKKFGGIRKQVEKGKVTWLVPDEYKRLVERAHAVLHDWREPSRLAFAKARKEAVAAAELASQPVVEDEEIE